MSDDAPDRIRHLEDENARLRRLLEQNGMPGALRHQVRNGLGLMRAVLRRSVEGKLNVEDYAAHLEGRFDALLRVQTLLLSSPDGCIDLNTLVLDELLSHAIQDGDRAKVSGSDVRIEARQAELLGLVLHELATNAIKFGALMSSEGYIEVAWTIEPCRKLRLVWAETGCRRSNSTPASHGFGMEAINKMLPYQLQAESLVEFLSEGLRCTIIVPLGALDSRAKGES